MFYADSVTNGQSRNAPNTIPPDSDEKNILDNYLEIGEIDNDYSLSAGDFAYCIRVESALPPTDLLAEPCNDNDE